MAEPRTVWIVKEDTSSQYDPSAYWVITKVFESESDAIAYAKEDIGREVEAFEVVPAHTATAAGHTS